MRFVCASVALSVAVLLAAPVLAADLPAWQLSRVDDQNLSNWGEPATEDDRTYRVAAGGEQAAITVPAWWGAGFRPEEGTVYNLKITYKDTATKPVVFSSHGGFARYWGLGEVHRFGGSGDGQWKVANVPVSWDLVCRRNVPFKGPTDTTQFGISADTDLPVASIVVEEAGPDAADRYGRETREWVAKAQAEKREKADRGPEQDAVLSEKMKEQPVVIYNRTYLVPLYQNSAPQKGEAGAPLKLRMAQNEYEPAGFGVYANGRALKNVTFEMGALLNEDGEKLSAEIEKRTAEYSAVNTRGRRDTGEPQYLMFPQRFWPMFPVDIEKDQSQWQLLTIRTLGDDTQPGTYRGKLTVKAEGGLSASVPVTVEVVPVHLMTMQEAGLELGGCSGAVPAQDLRTLAEHNHTGMHVWFGGVQPQIRVVDEKAEFDWTYLDDWMQRAKGYGMDHMMWFGGGDPYGFPDTINLERDLYRATADARTSNELRREYISRLNENPNKVLPEVRPRYKAFIRELAKFAEENNWPSKLIIHPFDEPAKWVQSHKWENPFHEVIGTGPWIKDHFQDACKLIREGAEGYSNILIGGDMHHATPTMVFLNDVDVYCTNAIHQDSQLARRVKEAGVQFWQYSGTGDHSPAHQARYTFGFFFAAYDSRGSLIWAYDSIGRFDTSIGGGQWGYGWYTPFGTVFTPYMIGVREGFDDRRWIETYKSEVGFGASQPVLQPIDVQAIEQRTRGGRDTVYDFYAEIDRVEKLDDWRNRVIDAVLKARSPKQD